MQNDNQNQNQTGNVSSNPDYGFIQEYSMPPPKKTDKKVIILIVLIIITILTIALGALIGGNNTQESSQTKTTQVRFIDNLRGSQDTQIYESLSPALLEIYDSETKFINDYTNPTRKLLSENECDEEYSAHDEASGSLIFECRLDDFDAWFGVGLLNAGQPEEAITKLCPITTEEMDRCE